MNMNSKKIMKYKDEINTKLMAARDVIEELILLVESNQSWKQIHVQTEYAVSQLKQSTQLLSRYHLEICIPNKIKRERMRITATDVREIIKTFNYTG